MPTQSMMTFVVFLTVSPQDFKKTETNKLTTAVTNPYVENEHFVPAGQNIFLEAKVCGEEEVATTFRLAIHNLTLPSLLPSFITRSQWPSCVCPGVGWRCCGVGSPG